MSSRPQRFNNQYTPSNRLRLGLQRRLPVNKTEASQRMPAGEKRLLHSNLAVNEPTTQERGLVSVNYNQPPNTIFINARQALENSSAAMWGKIVLALVIVVWLAGFGVGFQVALSVQMGLGIILAIFGLFSPSLGLLSIGLLATIDAMASQYLLTGGFLRFNTVNYWLLIVMVLYLPFILRLNDFISRALQAFIILLAMYLIISANVREGIQSVLNIATTFGLVVYFARALQDERVLYWLGVVTGVTAGLGGFLFFMQISQLPYANPNNWSYMQLNALFAICIALPYARAFNNSKLVLLALAVVNFTWIFLSGSRGTLLIALLCLGYLFLATRSITWKSVMIALVVLGGIWVSTQFVEQQVAAVSRIQLLFDTTQSERRRTSQRSALVDAGVELFRRNPLGVGTGNYRVEAATTGLVSENRPAHSAWIKTLAENGIPGIVLLVVFVLSFSLVGMKKHREGKLLMGLFITFVFLSAFVAKEFQGKSLWFMAAAGIVLLNPKETLMHLNKKLRPNQYDYRERLREVRLGRKR
jgi:O-antigen ligase